MSFVTLNKRGDLTLGWGISHTWRAGREPRVYKGKWDGADGEAVRVSVENPGNSFQVPEKRLTLYFPLNFRQFHRTKFPLLSRLRSGIKIHSLLCYVFCEVWNETYIQPNLTLSN